MANQEKFRHAIAVIVTKVRNIKNDINALWPDHQDVLDVEKVLEQFDRIVDGLFELLHCYNGHLSETKEENGERARGALVECVKAACTVLDPIAAKMEKKAAKAIPIWGGQAFASVSERLRLMKQLRFEAKKQWENDQYEGYESYIQCIHEFDGIIVEANGIKGAHRLLLFVMNPVLLFVLTGAAIILALVAIIFR
jgi:3-hydroxy-3-methylglutaryl CoA synthase